MQIGQKKIINKKQNKKIEIMYKKSIKTEKGKQSDYNRYAQMGKYIDKKYSEYILTKNKQNNLPQINRNKSRKVEDIDFNETYKDAVQNMFKINPYDIKIEDQVVEDKKKITQFSFQAQKLEIIKKSKELEKKKDIFEFTFLRPQIHRTENTSPSNLSLHQQSCHTNKKQQNILVQMIKKINALKLINKENNIMKPTQKCFRNSSLRESNTKNWTLHSKMLKSHHPL